MNHNHVVCNKVAPVIRPALLSFFDTLSQPDIILLFRISFLLVQYLTSLKHAAEQ